jgi:HSP20 family protein
MRFDPFREMDTVNQLLGRQSGRPAQIAIPMDAYREGDRFLVNMDLPGVDPDSVDLTVEKNVLTVRAERQWQPGNDNEVLVAERPQGAFSRQLFLGDGLDTQRVEATYRNGVLTLSIPVAEQAKPRKVAISRAETESEAIPAKVTAGANSRA